MSYKVSEVAWADGGYGFNITGEHSVPLCPLLPICGSAMPSHLPAVFLADRATVALRTKLQVLLHRLAVPASAKLRSGLDWAKWVTSVRVRLREIKRMGMCCAARRTSLTPEFHSVEPNGTRLPPKNPLAMPLVGVCRCPPRKINVQAHGAAGIAFRWAQGSSGFHEAWNPRNPPRTGKGAVPSRPAQNNLAEHQNAWVPIYGRLGGTPGATGRRPKLLQSE